MSEQQPGLAQSRHGALRPLAHASDHVPHGAGAGDTEADDVEVGQICLARPDRGPDLRVLVSRVHEDHVEAMLCGEEHQLATDTDSVLEPSATGCPAPILVHGDVSARILMRRLVASPGLVTSELVERIALRGRGLDFNSTDLGRGKPITGEADPRWEWKLDKLRQMRTVRARASELGWGIHQLGEAGPRED